jgi:hypothetical protein
MLSQDQMGRTNTWTGRDLSGSYSQTGLDGSIEPKNARPISINQLYLWLIRNIIYGV